jgi:diguanylate cyclase (GGDEF)-like protein
LVAEASSSHRLAAKQAVEALGHDCTVAENGDRAWALYEAGDFAVVISDWVMLGMDGDELCRRIRSSRGPYCYVIMLTSLDDKEHVLLGMRAGADDFLSKPLNASELESRLGAADQVTRLHHAVDEQRAELERLNEELHGQARQDPLTAVGNRLRLQEDMDRLEAGAERAGPTYAVVMCDIDHFKGLNDQRGHERGDQILRAVAKALVDASRRSDAVYRYGGEELVVVMPNCGAGQMAAGAERLRAQVERLALEHPADDWDVVTISVGVATRLSANGDGDGVDGILKRADDALYQAKHAGRNRVMVDGDEVPAG